jgi:hypothetical protein
VLQELENFGGDENSVELESKLILTLITKNFRFCKLIAGDISSKSTELGGTELGASELGEVEVTLSS